MKFRGRAIGGSSMLMMLGVVCFATVLVSAAIIITGAFSVTQTVNEKPVITMTGPGTGSSYADEQVVYTYTANVPVDLTAATITIDVSRSTNMASGDVTDNSVSVVFDGGTFTGVLASVGETGHYQCVIDVNSAAQTTGVVLTKSDYSGSVTLTFHTADTYNVVATMSGTAA